MPPVVPNKIVIRDLLKRKKKLKNEVKILILKSILQTRNIPIKQRIGSLVQLARLACKKNAITKQQNVCLISGKKKTTFKITNTSRYVFKKLGDLGTLVNIKR